MKLICDSSPKFKENYHKLVNQKHENEKMNSLNRINLLLFNQALYSEFEKKDQENSIKFATVKE